MRSIHGHKHPTTAGAYLTRLETLGVVTLRPGPDGTFAVLEKIGWRQERTTEEIEEIEDMIGFCDFGNMPT